MKFHIYPKEGERFEADLRKFEINASGDGFTLHDDANQITKEGYLSFYNVAAIIPVTLQKQDDMITFLVHLRDKDNPLEIFAHAFDVVGPVLTFLWQRTDMMGTILQEAPIDGIYIALSEVISILPADGLLSYRR